jgi:glutathione peroxidase-family protein
LTTYDKAGNKLSEASFLGHTHCGRIVDNYGASFFSIDKHFEIIERDTNLLFLMDTTNFSILDTIETNINFRKFKIGKSGKIVKINAS